MGTHVSLPPNALLFHSSSVAREEGSPCLSGEDCFEPMDNKFEHKIGH